MLPLHGPRRTGRRGGDGFFSGDFVDTVHAQAQAVWDVRRLLRWLREGGAPGIGLYGVSLGGYTAALLAGLEENVDCVIAGIPAADFLRLVRDLLPPVVLQAASYVGFPFEDIRKMLRVVSHTPLECEKLVAAQAAGGWIDAMRLLVPEPAKLYTWWSYRSPDWKAADKGRRLDHIWVAPALADRLSRIDVLKASRGWSRPSDHVPVTATLEL